MDATPIVITMITVGLTLVFAVAGAAWRVGMRLGGVEQGVAGCDERLRVLHIDVRDQGTRLHTDIQSVRTEVKAGNEGLRTEVKDNAQLVRTEVQDLRTEVKADVQLVRTEVQDLRTDVKADIQLVRTEVRDLRTEVKTDIQDLRSEVKADIQELRADVKTDIQELRTEVQELRTEVHADIGELRSEVRQTNDKLDRILERLPCRPHCRQRDPSPLFATAPPPVRPLDAARVAERPARAGRTTSCRHGTACRLSRSKRTGPSRPPILALLLRLGRQHLRYPTVDALAALGRRLGHAPMEIAPQPQL